MVVFVAVSDPPPYSCADCHAAASDDSLVGRPSKSVAGYVLSHTASSGDINESPLQLVDRARIRSGKLHSAAGAFAEPKAAAITII